MTTSKALAALAIVLFGFGIVLFSTTISFHNQETGLRTQYEAKIDANHADYDALWKIISQTAQVPAQYKADFAEVYGKIMEARYPEEAGGTLMRWIQEQNPQFDSSLYAKVQTVVESQRTSFANRQKELRDVKREHDKLVRQFPGAIFASFLGREELEAVVVTSDRTEEAFTTGTDNDTALFPQKE